MPLKSHLVVREPQHKVNYFHVALYYYLILQKLVLYLILLPCCRATDGFLIHLCLRLQVHTQFPLLQPKVQVQPQLHLHPKVQIKYPSFIYKNTICDYRSTSCNYKTSTTRQTFIPPLPHSSAPRSPWIPPRQAAPSHVPPHGYENSRTWSYFTAGLNAENEQEEQ